MWNENSEPGQVQASGYARKKEHFSLVCLVQTQWVNKRITAFYTFCDYVLLSLGNGLDLVKKKTTEKVLQTGNTHVFTFHRPVQIYYIFPDRRNNNEKEKQYYGMCEKTPTRIANGQRVL